MIDRDEWEEREIGSMVLIRKTYDGEELPEETINALIEEGKRELAKEAEKAVFAWFAENFEIVEQEYILPCADPFDMNAGIKLWWKLPMFERISDE